MKKCRTCKKPFEPTRPLQVACSLKCAVAVAENARNRKAKVEERKARSEQRRAKEGLKTRAELLREAQAAFNAYIRKRDESEPCISCGRYHEGQYHAGHYRSVGACPELRFDETNVHKQCAPCNNHLSGNAIEYRIRLKEKIGEEELERLEGPHDPKKYTADDARAIKAEYKAKLKTLTKERDDK